MRLWEAEVPLEKKWSLYLWILEQPIILSLTHLLVDRVLIPPYTKRYNITVGNGFKVKSGGVLQEEDIILDFLPLDLKGNDAILWVKWMHHFGDVIINTHDSQI